jgi:hypothetical protein
MLDAVRDRDKAVMIEVASTAEALDSIAGIFALLPFG